MKGIILAGGNGTRMHPITKSVSKQLLCIYDKPMIYYPLSTLLSAGITDILIISTPDDLHSYVKLLGSGNQLGIKISYIQQLKPEGLAQAFIIAKDFIGSENICMALGDNIFYGNGFNKMLIDTVEKVNKTNNATVFGYYVNNPNRYGVLGFDETNKITSIEEKPLEPKSNYAVIGLYFYPNSVVEIAKNIRPSDRNELEITSVNNIFLENKELDVQLLDSGYTWLDTGTPDSLLEASNFIQTIEKRQGKKVACIEEIAFNMGYINTLQLNTLAKGLKASEYGQYLLNIKNK
ncbi:MAG: glucose-1-phosphate thymidylyltransferase [Halobacteriovoraceae bacterium]|nr:glucose-1-phosphate thymidylyltransferase [Halobacteriovoraceae bacterium]|tara:strand:+ start:3313 stop:4188 length:876 start_codon:yes stop_codon:yes gene_type:complete